MNQEKVTIEQLCADESFQAYCLEPEGIESVYWIDWQNAHPEYKLLVAEAKRQVLNLGLVVSDDELADEWATLQKGMALRPQKSFSSRRAWLSAAASLLLLIGVLGYWQMNTAVTMTTIATGYGQQKSIELPDGSTVMLNAKSKITYAEDWTNDEYREVELEGEAFFEVETNKAQPLIVHTPKGDIRVLGTTFNVFQRAADLKVTLVEGKVQLKVDGKTNYNLNPGEEVLFRNNTLTNRKVDTKAVTAWSEGKWVFKNASIASIIARLQYEYGWTIKVRNKDILKRKVNASVMKNNPELLLEALTEIYDLDIQKLDKGVFEIQ